MQLHLAQGNRTVALRVFESCRKILSDELKLQPSPETLALAERIKNFRQRGDASALKQAELKSAISNPSVENMGAGLQSASETAPMVGRSVELAQLITAGYAVRRGQPQVVVIEGEAGIGKTRLATEFAQWALADGMNVWQGRAYEAGGHAPYQSLLAAVRQSIERENAPDDLLGDVWLAELSRLLPELRERYPDLPAPLNLNESEAQTRLYEAVAQWGQSLAARAPLIIFVDDVQWADAASLDVWGYALRRWNERHAPVLLLLTLRAELAHGTEPWLTELKRVLPLTRLTLRALTADHTLQFVQALSGEAPTTTTQEFSRWLFAETSGQPFFMVETLKALRERELLSLDDLASTLRALHQATASPLPGGVRAVVRARLARLSATAMDLSAAGAVLGQMFDFEGLCRVADVAERDGLRALDELLTGGILREEGRLTFTHDKIRAAVYSETGETRRRIFHRRALEALQATPTAAAILVHYALGANAVEAVLRFSLVAGDDALRLFAVREAIAHYERAQALVETGQSITPTNLRQLRQQLGRAYQLHSEPDKARAVYAVMLAEARTQADAVLECNALNQLAALQLQGATNFEQASELLHEAMRVAERSQNKAGLAESEWGLAQMHMYASQPAQASAHGLRALALARELDAPELMARCLNALGYAELALGHWAEAEQYAREAMTRYRLLGNRALELDCLGLLAHLQYRTGRLVEGLETARTYYVGSQKIENVWGQLVASVFLAVIWLDLGEYGEAQQIASQCLKLSQAAGVTDWLRVLALATVGNVSRACLDLDSARATHQQALHFAQSSYLPQNFVAVLSAELCADAVLAEQWEEAYAQAVRAIETRCDEVFPIGFSRWSLIEACVRAGDWARTHKEMRLLGELATSSPRYQLYHWRTQAAVAEVQGDWAQASIYWQAAVRCAEAMGSAHECWQLWARLGECYRAQGDVAQMQQVCRQALETVHALASRMADEDMRARLLAAEIVRRVRKGVGS